MRIEGTDHGLTDKRLTEYFLRQKAARERTVPREESPDIPSVITVSRQYGAGGRSVTSILRDRLGPTWDIWDRELIDAVAMRAEVRREMVQAMDERHQDWLGQMVQNVFGGGGMDTQAFRRHLAEVLLALAQQGRKIIVGRGANFVLPDALNVRLEADLGFRIKATMERLGLTRDAATTAVRRADRERADFTRGLFEKDIRDTSAYDLILRTDSLGYETSAEVILTAARRYFAAPSP